MANAPRKTTARKTAPRRPTGTPLTAPRRGADDTSAPPARPRAVSTTPTAPPADLLPPKQITRVIVTNDKGGLESFPNLQFHELDATAVMGDQLVVTMHDPNTGFLHKTMRFNVSKIICWEIEYPAGLDEAADAAKRRAANAAAAAAK